MTRSSLKKYRKKIFITGASGFIGSNLAVALKANSEVVIPSRKELDLTVKKGLDFFAKNIGKVDVIVHLASKFITAGKTDDMSVLYDNIKMAENVARIASITGCSKLINFSTIAVYPNISGVFSEDSPTDPSCNAECIYGLSKICTEKIFDHVLGKRGVTVVHLRIAQVYGEGMRKDRVISMMKEELNNRSSITVFGNGERESNFVFVGKVVDTVKFFLENDMSGTYNLGGEQLSYLQLAKKILRDNNKIDSSIILKEEGSRAKFVLDTSKLDRLILERIKE